MSFVTMFSSPGPDDDEQREAWTRQPPWFKPEDELGVPVPLGGVIARSERSVVGERVSNLGGHRGMRRAFSGEEPDGPILMPNGGGGGSGAPDSVAMRPGYWLWPLPPAGALRAWCEWPALEIPLSSLELDADAIHDAARRALPLWPKASSS